MSREPRVYLAGPGVFLPDAPAWIARAKATCVRWHLVGVSPLDPLENEPAGWAVLPEWQRIALRNEAHIRSCNALIANVTPFRGPSADVGTVYEVGFARALGLPVFGYATTTAAFLRRSLDHLGHAAHAGADGGYVDADGLLVEQFGLFDNLMIEGGILGSGGVLVMEDRPPAERWRDLSVFERCVCAVSERLCPGRPNGH